MTNNIWWTDTIVLPSKSRGFHLITKNVLDSVSIIKDVHVGLLHLCLQHTSASLTINENADPTVRQDLESYFNHSVKEDMPFYRHTYEGSDDMPAHIKSSLLGCEVTLPIKKGKLQLGTWQGIMLGEHRDSGGPRKIVATVHGMSAK